MTVQNRTPKERARIVAVVGKKKFLTIRKPRGEESIRITFPGSWIQNEHAARDEAAAQFRQQTGIYIDTSELHPKVTILRSDVMEYHIFVVKLSRNRYVAPGRRHNAVARSLDELQSLAKRGIDLSSTLAVIDALARSIDEERTSAVTQTLDQELGSCGAHVGPKGSSCTAVDCGGVLFK
jgi:hypothetical protein